MFSYRTSSTGFGITGERGAGLTALVDFILTVCLQMQASLHKSMHWQFQEKIFSSISVTFLRHHAEFLPFYIVSGIYFGNINHMPKYFDMQTRGLALYSLKSNQHVSEIDTNHSFIIHADNFRTCNIFLFSAMAVPSIQGSHWLDRNEICKLHNAVIHPYYYEEDSV